MYDLSFENEDTAENTCGVFILKQGKPSIIFYFDCIFKF